MDITVYGASDDLIEIDGAIREEFGYDDYDDNSDHNGDLLAFSDGTVLRIRRDHAGVWRITPAARGAADLRVDQAPEDDDDNRTDRATLTGDIRWVVHGTGIATA